MTTELLYSGVCVGDKVMLALAFFIASVAATCIIWIYILDNQTMLRYKLKEALEKLELNLRKFTVHNYEKYYNCPPWADVEKYKQTRLPPLLNYGRKE